MQAPLVSIVMPAKNASKYVKECLDSILCQSLESWELISIDDHSSDDTMDILASYAYKDDRIRVYPATGVGIIAALQQAYSKTNGQYITRMDADDRMTQQKLEILWKQLKEQGRGNLSTGGVTYFSESELGQGYKKYEVWLNRLTADGINFQEIYKECVIPSPAWMLHRSDFEECGGFESNIYPEDYDLCFRFYRAGLKVIPNSAILHYWRDYPERTSRNHEHYADNSFLKLKVNYFIELDLDRERGLIIWGAGKKSKKIARLFQEQQIDFQWCCNNPKKIGHKIYDVILLDQELIDLRHHPQIVIAIANPEERAAIRSRLTEQKQKGPIDDFYFC